MKSITRTAALGITAGALLLVGCGSSDDASSTTTEAKAKATTTTVAAELEITDAWARQSPMGTTAGAVYLTITSPVDDSLTGASVPTNVAKTTEIHETVAADDSSMGDESTTTAMDETTTTAMDESTTTAMGGDTMDDGSMTMKPVDSIELPAGEAVKLEPGGYHIMLLDLVAPLEVGQSIEVTLTFEKAGEKTVTAEVREG